MYQTLISQTALNIFVIHTTSVYLTAVHRTLVYRTAEHMTVLHAAECLHHIRKKVLNFNFKTGIINMSIMHITARHKTSV